MIHKNQIIYITHITYITHMTQEYQNLSEEGNSKGWKKARERYKNLTEEKREKKA